MFMDCALESGKKMFRRQHRILLTAAFTCDHTDHTHLNYFTLFFQEKKVHEENKNKSKAELRRDQYFVISGIWIGSSKYVYNITLKGGFGE